MRERWSEFERRGARVLVVSFDRGAALERYRAALALPFAVAADPDRSVYRAYGLVRGSRWQAWHPRTLLRYVVLTARGMKLQRPTEDADLLQLGGDFVVDAAGRLRFVHPSARPDDRPGVDALLGALA